MVHALSYLFGLILVSSRTLAKHGGEGWPFTEFQTGPWRPPHLMMANYGEVNHGKFFISVRTINKGFEEFFEDGNPGTAATIYDDDGEMIWQGPQQKTMDFKMQRLFGQDVITYWSGETGVVGYGYGSVHILDTSYNEIYTVTLNNNNFNTHDGVERDTYVDVHEHLITPQNTIILSAINISQADTSDRPGGFPDTWVIDCQFYEVNITTNEILFSWSALDHPDYLPLADSKNSLGQTGKDRENPWDAFHMNSVQPVDGGYVASIRFWWSAFCVSQDGTLRWQLSGGGPEEGTIENDAHFAWQHDIRVYNETDNGLVLTVFDNHARMIDGPSGETTGMVIDVDLVNMKGSTVRRVNSAASDPSESRTQGSFQLLDYDTTGHMFMGYGSMCKFKEYDGDGKIVQTGQFGYIGHAQSYRLLKYPWKAIPYWKPDVVARHISQFTTDTTVYMSWNGATEHDNWNIYSVPDADSTIDDATFLVNHPRYGFETPVSLRFPEVEYIIVEARQGEKVLGTSETATVQPMEDFDK